MIARPTRANSSRQLIRWAMYLNNTVDLYRCLVFVIVILSYCECERVEQARHMDQLKIRLIRFGWCRWRSSLGPFTRLFPIVRGRMQAATHLYNHTEICVIVEMNRTRCEWGVLFRLRTHDARLRSGGRMRYSTMPWIRYHAAWMP